MRERETDWQKDRKTERQRHRETETETERLRDTETQRHRDRETERETPLVLVVTAPRSVTVVNGQEAATWACAARRPAGWLDWSTD